MSNIEAENISRYLRTKEIQLPSNNKWLLDCINWYKSHSELRNIYNCLEDYVCVQWLLSDLRDVQNRCLPTNCKDGTIQLTNKYSVQVNSVRDISQPCYTQLQALKNVNIADSNENVTAEETKKQNWEPSPKRVLMMEITDGYTTLKAMEYSPIQKLTEPFIPGFKVILIGPIECRKGILFLKNNNITLLGGEVDLLSDIYSKENILSRCLNIVPSHNIDSRREPNGPVTISPTRPAPPPPPDNRPQPLFNDMDQLPDSTSFIGSNPFDNNRDVIMAEDDDDMLCQLPDTMFNDIDNFDPQPNRLSPVLDENSADEVQSSTHEDTAEEIPLLYNRAKNTNKPKLFPSVEDLRPGKESMSLSNIKQSTLSTLGENSKQTQPGTSSTNRYADLHVNTFNSSATVSSNIPLQKKPSVSLESVSSFNKTTVEHSRPVEQELRGQNSEKFNDSLGNRIDDLLGETDDENIYPQFKRVRIKVISITKLKIRNSEWTCCASVSMEDKTENVTFCNKVLEKLFGTSAAEVEVLRSEMAKNQSLKEKINNILKAGQTKLKLLNCLMVVEYTSKECTPNIVSIHED